MTDKLDALINETVADWRGNGFELSKTDCGFSTALYIQRVTGIDPLEEIRGKYTDKDNLDDWLETRGGVLAAFTEYMGKIGVHPSLSNNAKRGDVVFANYQGIEAIGLCLGDFCVFKTRAGTFMTKRALIKRVWPCSLD